MEFGDSCVTEVYLVTILNYEIMQTTVRIWSLVKFDIQLTFGAGILDYLQ